MTPVPLILRIACLLLAGFCLLTSPAGIYVCAVHGRWYTLAFECVVLLSSLGAVLTGLGKVRFGAAMSIFVTGSIVAAAAVLSEPTLVARVIQGGGGSAPASGPNLVPWVVARLGAGVGLVGISGLILLLRAPGVSLMLLAKGVLLGLPVLAAGALVVVPSLRAKLMALSPMPAVFLSVIGVAVLGVLVSLSAHCLIRAFEVGAQKGIDEARAARA